MPSRGPAGGRIRHRVHSIGAPRLHAEGSVHEEGRLRGAHRGSLVRAELCADGLGRRRQGVLRAVARAGGRASRCGETVLRDALDGGHASSLHVSGYGNHGGSADPAAASLSMGRRRPGRVPDSARTTWCASGYGRDHHLGRVNGIDEGRDRDSETAFAELVVRRGDASRSAGETDRHAVRACRHRAVGDGPARIEGAGGPLCRTQLVSRIQDAPPAFCREHLRAKRDHVGARW